MHRPLCLETNIHKFIQTVSYLYSNIVMYLADILDAHTRILASVYGYHQFIHNYCNSARI